MQKPHSMASSQEHCAVLGIASCQQEHHTAGAATERFHKPWLPVFKAASQPHAGAADEENLWRSSPQWTARS